MKNILLQKKIQVLLLKALSILHIHIHITNTVAIREQEKNFLRQSNIESHWLD